MVNLLFTLILKDNNSNSKKLRRRGPFLELARSDVRNSTSGKKEYVSPVFFRWLNSLRVASLNSTENRIIFSAINSIFSPLSTISMLSESL